MRRKEQRATFLRSLTVACDLLNGDLNIPRAARKKGTLTQVEDRLDAEMRAQLLSDPNTAAVVERGERLSENADSLAALSELHVAQAAWGSSGRRVWGWGRGRPRITESDRARRALLERLAPEGVTREDVMKLLDCLRLELRGQSLWRALQKHRKERAFVRFLLLKPFETRRWPRPSERVDGALRQWFDPRFENFLLFVETCRQWFAESWGHAFQAALTQPPKTFEDAYLCLLTAYALSVRDSANNLPLRACLACPRFLIAGRPTRETCGDTCRQRLYRGTQDEAGLKRLREQAKEYKRAQRKPQASKATAPHQPTPAKSPRASRTSRRPR